MYKKVSIAILSLIVMAGLPAPSRAETVLEKVARTGVLTAGTRSDAIPMSYLNAEGKWDGYSVEILRFIERRLERELNRKIDLEFVDVEVGERIPKLITREVDIICEVVSYSWERERFIDYSVNYGITGTSLLMKKGRNLGTIEALKGKRIGILPDSTNEQVIKLFQPEAILVPLEKGIREALTALQRGRIDAFAADKVILEGLRITSRNPDRLEILPKQPFNREGLACMLPEDDSSFRDMVNFTLVTFLQEVVRGEGDSAAMFNSWFGPEGIIKADREPIYEFFRFVIDSHSQIPPAKTQTERSNQRAQ